MTKRLITRRGPGYFLQLLKAEENLAAYEQQLRNDGYVQTAPDMWEKVSHNPSKIMSQFEKDWQAMLER